MGGLGDSKYSFLPWINELVSRKIPHLYIEFEANEKTSFSDRVDSLRKAVKEYPEKVTIIGQSAGGLAALIVASEIPEKINRVIAVSPAMPRGISPIGWPLIPIMAKYFWRMLRSKLITVSEGDYEKLALNGVLDSPNLILISRKPISGREAFELAVPWLQPELGKISVPTVLIYGTEDRWVSPKAHKKLFTLLAKLAKNSKQIKEFEIAGGGHLPVHSIFGGRVAVIDVLNEIKAQT